MAFRAGKVSMAFEKRAQGQNFSFKSLKTRYKFILIWSEETVRSGWDKGFSRMSNPTRDGTLVTIYDWFTYTVIVFPWCMHIKLHQKLETGTQPEKLANERKFPRSVPYVGRRPPLEVVHNFRMERIFWESSEPLGFQNEIFDCLATRNLV